jgi:hypothetical protein
LLRVNKRSGFPEVVPNIVLHGSAREVVGFL